MRARGEARLDEPYMAALLRRTVTPPSYFLLATGCSLLTAGLLTADLDEPRPQLCIDEDVEAEELEGVGLVRDGVMHLQRVASSE